ncbi:MAG TPA: hypothetical protein PLA77_04450, partial [Bacteroidales bacterium]|nr:hypothetical protein [Bacteroidales bacterium]
SNCTAVDAAKGCICKTRDKVIYDTQSPMMRAPELSIQEFDSVIELLKTEPISRQLVENHYQVFHFFYREGITQHPDTLIKYSVY